MSREVVLRDDVVGGIPEWELVAAALDVAAGAIGGWPMPASNAVGVVTNRNQSKRLREVAERIRSCPPEGALL